MISKSSSVSFRLWLQILKENWSIHGIGVRELVRGRVVFYCRPTGVGAHEPPRFIVNQRQGERKRRTQQNRIGLLSAATPLCTGRPRRPGGHLALLVGSLICDNNVI